MSDDASKRDRSEDELWQACREGELSRAVNRIRTRRRDRAIAAGVGVVGAALTLVLLVGLTARQFTNPAAPPDELATHVNCPFVKKNLAAYVRGSMDQETMHAVGRHLGRCGSCRSYYERAGQADEKPNDKRSKHKKKRDDACAKPPCPGGDEKPPSGLIVAAELLSED